jgi:ribosomal protein L35AE/L33A
MEGEAAQHATVEREAAERTATEAVARQCVVPYLQGESLGAARHSLSAAHCRLGKVSRTHGHRGVFVVKSQSPEPDKKLASDATVEVRLGFAKRSRG